MEYQNVVFLVLDNRLLMFAGGARIRGLLGFPVVDWLGEIEWIRDGRLRIPATVPQRNQPGIAVGEPTLDGST